MLRFPKKKRRTILSGLGAALGVIVVLTSLFISFGINYYSNRIILSSVHQYSIGMLNLQAASHEQQRRGCFQKAWRMLEDENVTRLRSAPLILRKKAYYYSISCDLIAGDDRIFSVYIINGQTEEVIVMGKGSVFRSFDDFYDAEALELFYDAQTYPGGSIITRTVPYGNGLYSGKIEGRDVTVSTLIIRQKVDGYPTAILMNCLFDLTEDYTFLAEDSYHYCMLDRSSGWIVFSTEPDSRISDSGVYGQLLARKDREEIGSSVMRTDDGKYIVTWMESPQYNRILVSVLPYNAIGSRIRMLQNASMIISGGSCLIALALILWLLRRKLVSLNAFFRHLGKLLRFPLNDRALTSEDLRRYQEGLIADYDYFERLEKDRSDNSHYLACTLLREQLENPSLIPRSVHVDLNIDLSGECLLVLIGSEEPVSAAALEKLLRDGLRFPRRELVPERTGDRVMLILQGVEPDAAFAAVEAILDAHENLTGVMSEPAVPGDWPETSLRLREAMNSRYSFGEERLIRPDAQRDCGERIAQLCGALHGALSASDPQEAQRQLEELADTLRENRVINCRPAIESVMSMLIRFRREDNAGSAWSESALSGLIAAVNEAEHPAQAFGILSEFLSEQGCAENVDAPLVKRIEKLVGEQLNDPELSPNRIAEELDYSIAYVNRCFYRARGIRLTQYIQQRKLEKIRTMLITGDDSIDDILNAAGWTNKKYFFTVFKKTYNMTSSEYREKYRTEAGS